ncbi:MAG: recombinase family protein [Acidobacteriaceae bacterium]
MKRAALYMRVSTVDQHPETQLLELRRFAEQRGFEIAQVYTDLGMPGRKQPSEHTDSSTIHHAMSFTRIKSERAAWQPLTNETQFLDRRLTTISPADL